MTDTLLARSAFGPTVARIALVAAAAGTIVLGLGCARGETRTVLALLLATWLLFAGMAAGAVALSAVIRVSHGWWARQALPVAEAAARFFWPAWVLLLLVLLGAPFWMPQLDPWQVGRDVAVAAVLFAVGQRYVARSAARSSGAVVARPMAALYLLLFAAGLSVWAVDLIMTLRDWAPNTVVPAFYFCGAFLGGIASTTLVSTAMLESLEVPTRQDLGKLLFACATIWGYLLWSAYLPVWYDNLPDETGQLLERWNGNWRYLSVAALFGVLVLPCSLLLNAAAKRARLTIAIASSSVLLGLVGEHLLFVLPSLSVRGGPMTFVLGAGSLLGMTGIYVLALGSAGAHAFVPR